MISRDSKFRFNLRVKKVKLLMMRRVKFKI